MTKKRGPKKCFRGRQVGAFSVFWQGDTGGPFIFGLFLLFFQKIDRFRGWCNITPSPANLLMKNRRPTGSLVWLHGLYFILAFILTFGD